MLKNPNDYVILDVHVEPETYAWPRRALTWVIWKCPIIRWPARLLFKRRNPYRRVVAKAVPRTMLDRHYKPGEG